MFMRTTITAGSMFPRGNQVLVFDLDSLKTTGSITNARARESPSIPRPSTAFPVAVPS